MKISTSAKDIALYFIDVTSNGRATPTIIAKTINQAKSLLQNGYTKEEIIQVIDYLIQIKKVNLFSLGYINASINNVLREIKEKQQFHQHLKEVQQIQQEIASINDSTRSEVIQDNDSTQRNQNKLSRFGIQSRFGEESFGDLFKKQ